MKTMVGTGDYFFFMKDEENMDGGFFNGKHFFIYSNIPGIKLFR